MYAGHATVPVTTEQSLNEQFRKKMSTEFGSRDIDTILTFARDANFSEEDYDIMGREVRELLSVDVQGSSIVPHSIALIRLLKSRWRRCNRDDPSTVLKKTEEFARSITERWKSKSSCIRQCSSKLPLLSGCPFSSTDGFFLCVVTSRKSC